MQIPMEGCALTKCGSALLVISFTLFLYLSLLSLA